MLKLAITQPSKRGLFFFLLFLQIEEISLQNEVAYPGVNLMGDMLVLLIRFRTNKYVLLADIRKAFFMIRLSSEKDLNHFRFFYGKIWITTDIRHIRFQCKSFYSKYVLKFHADKFPPDEHYKMLSPTFTCII